MGRLETFGTSLETKPTSSCLYCLCALVFMEIHVTSHPTLREKPGSKQGASVISILMPFSEFKEGHMQGTIETVV